MLGAWFPAGVAFAGGAGRGGGGGTCLPPQEDEAAPAAAGVAGHRGPPPRAAASGTVPSRGACSARSSRGAGRREREWGGGGGRTRAPEPRALPPPTRDPRGRARHPFVPGVPEGGGQQRAPVHAPAQQVSARGGAPGARVGRTGTRARWGPPFLCLVHGKKKLPPGLPRVRGEAGNGVSPRGRVARVPLAQGPGPGGALFSASNFARLERGATWRDARTWEQTLPRPLLWRFSLDGHPT